MAVFGRDSLITGLQTLAVDPSLARGALRVVGRVSGKVDDPFRDAEPGKIPHEIRHGRLSHHGKVPHSRYFGTVDATPLFLHTLAETVRWTGDLELARELLPAAELALRWIDSQETWMEMASSNTSDAPGRDSKIRAGRIPTIRQLRRRRAGGGPHRTMRGSGLCIPGKKLDGVALPPARRRRAIRGSPTKRRA